MQGGFEQASVQFRVRACARGGGRREGGGGGVAGARAWSPAKYAAGPEHRAPAAASMHRQIQSAGRRVVPAAPAAHIAVNDSGRCKTWKICPEHVPRGCMHL